MRIFLFILGLTLFPFGGWSQSIKKQLAQIEAFLDSHIPTNHFSVTGYKLSISKGILTKETLVEDGTSHMATYMLKAPVTYEQLQMDDEAAEVYGFKNYWEVYIGGSWILTEILEEKDALKLMEMIQQLQESLD